LDPSNFVNENEPLKVTTFVSPAPKSGHIWKMLRPFCVCMVPQLSNMWVLWLQHPIMPAIALILCCSYRCYEMEGLSSMLITWFIVMMS